MSEAETILIGICTFRRASLDETLRSVAALPPLPGFATQVVVADNDDTPTARDAVARAAETLGLPIDYLHAPARNISIARNAILDHAAALGSRYLAFIDDDETVDADWLPSLKARLDESGEGAVIGPVRAAYKPDAPEWMQRGAVHDTEPDVDAGGFAHTGYSCNLLVDLSDPRLGGLRFELERGRSGGEDTAYFARYLASGGRIAYAPDAVVREIVPETRASRKWLLQRRYRMGQTHGGLTCEGASLPRRLREAGLAGLKLGYCLGAAAGSIRDPLPRNRALIRGALHAGAISGCLGSDVIQLYGGSEGSVDDTSDRR